MSLAPSSPVRAHPVPAATSRTRGTASAEGVPVRRAPRTDRTLTRVQEAAIRRAMQIFVEEDLAFGGARTVMRWCVRCQAGRPGAGFVAYDAGGLCNPCATLYELARMRGTVRTPADFVGL